MNENHTLFAFYDPRTRTFGYNIFHTKDDVGYFDDDVTGFETLKEAINAGCKVVSELGPEGQEETVNGDCNSCG
jgi:hypothetical protein